MYNFVDRYHDSSDAVDSHLVDEREHAQNQLHEGDRRVPRRLFPLRLRVAHRVRSRVLHGPTTIAAQEGKCQDQTPDQQVQVRNTGTSPQRHCTHQVMFHSFMLFCFF